MIIARLALREHVFAFHIHLDSLARSAGGKENKGVLDEIGLGLGYAECRDTRSWLGCYAVCRDANLGWGSAYAVCCDAGGWAWLLCRVP